MKIPEHISIIMDGNGRWAKRQGMPRLLGHKAGVESVRECCEYCAEQGVRYLSLFAFSSENWNRPESEINGLMELMLKAMAQELDNFNRNNVRFLVVGNLSRLSQKLRDAIDAFVCSTASNTGLTVIVMLSYSGKWDIRQAAEHYAADCLARGEVVPLEDSDFSTYLATAGIPDPDFLIRTSGELRISNYMLWQTAYTEFYFTPVLWPDFRKKELAAAIEEYGKRERRYGKVQ